MLNESGEAIPGLYAADEMAGGVHTGNRLGGNAVAGCFVLGKIVSEMASAE